MILSYFTGVSGMVRHQEWLDVLADNVANINTVGYKRSRITFQDTMSIYERGAIGPRVCAHPRGGINAKQIGLGVADRTIDVIHSQGLGFDDSDKVTDVAISGNGYFILKNTDGASYYTRAGAFDFDAKRNLVNPGTGMYVQGWMAVWDAALHEFTIKTGAQIENIKINIGEILPAKATKEVIVTGNLDANVPVRIPDITITKTLPLRSLQQVVSGDNNQLNPTADRSETEGGFTHSDTGWDTGRNPTPASTISIRTSGTSGATNYVSRPLSTYTSLNNFLEEINNLSGIKITYDEYTDMFTIRAKNRGDTITLGETGPQGFLGFWSAINMPTGEHNTVKTEIIKFTRLLTPQKYHNDRELIRWEVVDPQDGSPIPMVASATSSVVNKGANGTNRVSSAEVGHLNLLQPFARAGFDEQSPGVPWNWNSRITIYSSAYASEGGYGRWTSKVLSDYVSVDEFLSEVNNQDSAPVTISYDIHTDTFTVINDVPGTAVLITQTEDNGFVDAAKFQVYDTPLPANFLWLGQAQTTNRTAVFRATTLPARGILELDPITNKVIRSWRDTSENCNNVLELETEIPGTTAISTTARMRPRVFGGDLWPHTTRTTGTGYDYVRLTNGQIRESIWVRTDAPGDEHPRGVGHVKAGTASPNFVRVFTLDRNDVDPNRVEVTINNSRVHYVRPGQATPTVGAYFTFSDNTGPGGRDELLWHQNGANDLQNDQLLEINYVRLGHSNLAPSDTFIPNGNEGPEDITFRPNTGKVTDYEAYSPDDKKRNGFPELADSGDPVTATKSHQFLYTKEVKVYDSQGEEKGLTFVFERLDTKKWLWTVRNPVEKELLAGYGVLIFNYDGTYNRYESETYQSPSDPATYDGDNGAENECGGVTIGYRGIYIDQPKLGYPADFGGSPPHEMGAAILKIAVDFRSLLEQADLTLRKSNVGLSQDGYPMGRLKEITIDQEGIIWGNYTNDQQQPRAQLAIANFTNPSGLDRVAGTMFKETANSGEAEISEAKEIGSRILSKKLEKSNVDLAAQFIEMILAERGFMATGRIVTQADRMIMDLMRMRM